MRYRHSRQDFTRFYRTYLEETVQEIEHKRQASIETLARYKERAKRVCSLYCLFIPFLVLFAQIGALPLLLVGFACIWAIFYTFPYYKHKKQILRTIKEQLITQIVQFLEPSFRYNPDIYISKHHFHEANFYDAKDIAAYDGEDYVQGKIGNLSIEFSEIEVLKEEKNERTVILFKGLFFMIDFHKSFYGNVLAIPKIEQKHRYAGVKKTNYTKNRLEEAQLENPDFNQQFAVRTSDQTLARYIFTPTFMERMLQLQQQMGVTLFFSFQDGKMYLGVKTKKDHFDIDIDQPINEDVLYAYFGDIKMAFDIVEELNLNTNIWKK